MFTRPHTRLTLLPKALVAALALHAAASVASGQTLKHYYMHDAVADRYGVIAPWYGGQNGQFDFRVRVAAEVMKRFPWIDGPGGTPLPTFVYNRQWKVNPDGQVTATAGEVDSDLGQRAAYLLASMIDYYRYAGDPASFPVISVTADYLIDHCETSADHAWPHFLISVPITGATPGTCGFRPEAVEGYEHVGNMQLDLVAEIGLQLLHAYEMTGTPRWYETAKHWADLLAGKRNRDPQQPPWGRYADKTGDGMHGVQTGGVVPILLFFDELIRTGYRGDHDELVAARDAGRAYLQNTLLPDWALQDTWGRNYWDHEGDVQQENMTEFVATYLMDHQQEFPSWKSDVRNILSLFINNTSVAPEPQSAADTYHGAWAYPEASDCCGSVLVYGPTELATVFSRYGVEAHSAWGKEIARRSLLLATYDCIETGECQDVIGGGRNEVYQDWFKIAHPMPLTHVLRTMGWLPEVMGANRENHLMRTSSVVRHVVYGTGAITYTTFDAPPGTVDVLRLAFVPSAVTANGRQLPRRKDLADVGYTVEGLANGDAIVSVRHDGSTTVAVTGDDPQVMVDDQTDDRQLRFDERWQTVRDTEDYHGGVHRATAAGATMTYAFRGNQVRVVGRTAPDGGIADVVLDGIPQPGHADCYGSVPLHQQILYYKNGLTNGPHTLTLVLRGAHIPLSHGDAVYVDAVQTSEATGEVGFGAGGGPTEAQRLVFGYTKRPDYVDTRGNAWRPGTEFLARGAGPTAVAMWWTTPRVDSIRNTKDPELYRYGIHGDDLPIKLTVGPGRYHVLLKFAETQYREPGQRAVTISINDRKVVENLDVFATAGGADKAVDLVFDNIEPRNGIIAVHLEGGVIDGRATEAMLQALEVGPGAAADRGATPVGVTHAQTSK